MSTTIGMTSGSASATVASATGLFVGMYVSHPKVPSGTKINAISGTTLTLSNNASGTVSTSAVRFSPILDAQTLGAVGGAISKSTTLVTANLPAYTPSGTIGSMAGTAAIPQRTYAPSGSTVSRQFSAASNVGSDNGNLNVSLSSLSATFTGVAQGGTSTPIISPTVSPTIVMNYIIKRCQKNLASVRRDCHHVFGRNARHSERKSVLVSRAARRRHVLGRSCGRERDRQTDPTNSIAPSRLR